MKRINGEDREVKEHDGRVQKRRKGKERTQDKNRIGKAHTVKEKREEKMKGGN